MAIFYYTKPDTKKWSGDDHGAKEKAQAIAKFSEIVPLNNKLIQDRDKKIKGKIVVKGTNIEDLLDQIKEYPDQFNLDKITFIVGGNQTQKTIQFIDEIRKINKECKIEADIMPGTLDEELTHTDDNTHINITYNAITGTTPENVHKNLFEKGQTRALLDLEQESEIAKQDATFVTVHWGGAVAGKGISDEEQKLHKQELVSKLKEIRKKHANLKILFVPHGRRSFLPQENSSTTKEERKQDVISTLNAEFGEDNINTDLNYHVALEFTRKHQEQCAGIVSTAENLSTIAEQLSILNPESEQKPPAHILLFPCCEFNNDIWRNSNTHQLNEGWSSNAEIDIHHGGITDEKDQTRDVSSHKKLNAKAVVENDRAQEGWHKVETKKTRRRNRPKSPRV